MQWLARWYARRVVNVNVNVLVAGLLAVGITVVVMHFLGTLGLTDWLTGAGTGKGGGIWPKVVIGGLTFVVDAAADVLVYYGLHWIANHWPGASRADDGVPRMSFLRDATLVQMERAALSPLLYLIALGGQHAMLHLEFSIAMSTAMPFLAGIVVTRVIHTAWMLRQERRWKTAAASVPARASGGAHGDGTPVEGVESPIADAELMEGAAEERPQELGTEERRRVGSGAR